jgi:hypothetical protein
MSTTELTDQTVLRPAAQAFELYATRPFRYRSVLIGKRTLSERREAIRAHLLAQGLADKAAEWDDELGVPAALVELWGDGVPSWREFFEKIYGAPL